jgi:hypothetical protein
MSLEDDLKRRLGVDDESMRRRDRRLDDLREKLRSDPQFNIAIIQSAANGIRKMVEQLRLKNVSPHIFGPVCFDLLIDSIKGGAFSGPDWHLWRTNLISDTSLNAAMRTLGTLAPAGQQLHIPENFQNDTQIEMLAGFIERFTKPTPAPVPPQTMSLPAPPLPREPTAQATPEPIPPDHHEEILQALFQLKAFDPRSRRPAASIAKEISADLDSAKLKEPMSALARQGFIRTKTGRGGGAWLTEAGRKKAEEIEKR